MCGILAIISEGLTFSEGEFLMLLEKLRARGPDNMCYKVVRLPEINIIVYLGFTRLAIMDLSDHGNQPFYVNEPEVYTLCNGEIYNYEELVKKYDLTLKSKCDCEIVPYLYNKIGFKQMIDQIDAEFAMIILDVKYKQLLIARDRYGVRPMFYGYNNDRKIYGYSSELKGLSSVMDKILPVDPQIQFCIDLSTKNLVKFIDEYSFHTEECNLCNDQNTRLDVNLKVRSERENNLIKNSCGEQIGNESESQIIDLEHIQSNLRRLFIKAVSKRLHSDRPMGFLLSGGLDSSLVVAVACEILGSDNVVCFTIGLPGSPDVEAAKEVVKFLKISKHHIISFSIENGMAALENVIEINESYDVTTTRASTPQYLMARYICRETDIRAILSGEGSDEIHGSYRYFRDAPGPKEFHCECLRLLKELYQFDNLRTDRTMASQGLEVRIPFLDHEYVKYVLSLDPKLWMSDRNTIEKKLLRDSFKSYLPDSVLYRSKEAFSDAVSSKEVNWYQSIQSIVNLLISDNELIENKGKYVHNPPQTKEALFYRRIFNKYYPTFDNVITHYWLPRFQSEKIEDPSATILKCY